YSIFEVKEKDLLEDMESLLDLYYGFIFDYYLEQIESAKFSDEGNQDSPEESKKAKRRKTIDPEAHRKLLKQQQEQAELVGKMAEQYVFELEKKRLKYAGRPDLAEKVAWVAKEKDGLGFDVLSWDLDGNELFIEVKGSALAHEVFRFFLTPRELEVRAEKGAQYQIVLVENALTENIRVVEIISDDNFEMKPALYKCSYKKER
ncbi:DUF3883 domain-containing protein, partial [Neobacillus vireti]|uniref:DUF3883 domain-containing protein n=1 Tax=Neobacillus vireti TaxID=220686 RepID=UPI003000D596